MEKYQTRGNGPCNQASDPSLYWPVEEGYGKEQRETD